MPCDLANLPERIGLGGNRPGTRAVSMGIPDKQEPAVADNPTLTRPQDAQRIHIHQEHELRYWRQKPGVSAEVRRDAVEQVGPMVEDVADFIDAEKRSR